MKAYAAKGSQRWLQVAVNQAPELIDQPIRDQLRLQTDAQIDWHSPIAATAYGEYRDQAFLDLLGVPCHQASLHSFWPRRGAMWDGLATAAGRYPILVEAKAHIPELFSPPTRAKDPTARALIEESLRKVQQAIAPRAQVDWSGIFYQYANRVAHLYHLNELNGHQAHLVFVYFLNARDVFGPSSREEWLGALRIVEGYLGLHRHRLGRYIHKVFVDVNELPFPVG